MMAETYENFMIFGLESTGEKVRLELGLPEGNKWHQQQLGFLRGHEYHTEIARKLRNPGKATNIQKLEKILQETKC